MVFLQSYEHIGICRPNRATIVVGHVDAAIGEPNVVNNVVQLAGGDNVADGVLDKITQTRRLLNTGACWRADMHKNLTGIDGGKKVLSEEWQQSKGENYAGDEPGSERLGSA